MGLLANQRISRPGLTQGDDLPISNGGAPSSSSYSNTRKKWSNLLPLVVVLVIIAEISFLGRLDMAKNAALLADSFYKIRYSTSAVVDGTVVDEVEVEPVGLGIDRRSDLGSGGCEAWLEREDSVEYSRDFDKDPVLVHGGDQEWEFCAVGCKFGYSADKKPDAIFGISQQSGTFGVLRSMESAEYYAENKIDVARRRGFSIVMTTSLSSDVPVGYFSWAEYDIMAPVQPKTEKALAAAFISNCGAKNFRLQALEALEKADISIDSYGGCHRNRDGNVDKVKTLKRYKFSLAFENSNEEDYVTEKFFQSLVAGSVPVVVGTPNIEDFAPAPGSILYIKELSDVGSIAKTMKYLAGNAEAYNKTLSWKFHGPSDSFKALVDMAAVHSSCRLCIHLATTIRQKEEESSGFPRRPCKCTRGVDTVYHVYVRERGRFNMESIFLRSSNLTLESFESAILFKFQSLKHVPIWKEERPASIRGSDQLKIYRIYPVGKTQREALYTFSFKGDDEFRAHVDSNPCPKFEVIFV